MRVTSISSGESFAPGYGDVLFPAEHFPLFRQNVEADRAILRDVVEMPAVDAGHGWLIFRLPSAEIAAHPGAGLEDSVEIAAATCYPMCRALHATIARLEANGAMCGHMHRAR